MKKALMAAFEDFFASPTRQKFDELLHSHVGEYDNLDFKGEWPDYSSIARHILAMGNCGGGALVIGVSQSDDGSLKAEGLQSIKDKADIHKGVSKYLPKLTDKLWEVINFPFEDGRKFQVVLVEYLPHILPLVSEADGAKINIAKVYVRRGTCSVEANYHELQKVLNARIETGHSSTNLLALQGHLDELRMLYKRIPAYTSFVELIGERWEQAGSERNPDYPQESYEQYIAKLIERKKRIIDALIGESAP
jgi:predicted HTH transcriptional regulator